VSVSTPVEYFHIHPTLFLWPLYPIQGFRGVGQSLFQLLLGKTKGMFACGREAELPDKAHACHMQAQHRKKLSRNSKQKPSDCESTVLTTTPSCSLLYEIIHQSIFYICSIQFRVLWALKPIPTVIGFEAGYTLVGRGFVKNLAIPILLLISLMDSVPYRFSSSYIVQI